MVTYHPDSPSMKNLMERKHSDIRFAKAVTVAESHLAHGHIIVKVGHM